MVTYKCPRCNYTTDHKTKYTRHQNRKNKCKNINNFVDTNDNILKMDKSNPMGHPGGNPDDQNYPPKNKVIRMTAKSYPKYTPNEDVLNNKKNNIQLQKTKNLKCRHCNELFTKKQNRWRHEKYRCTQNPNVIKLSKKLIDNDKIGMKLLSYNETNRLFLTDDMISFCMQQQNRCIPEMIKLVHFNNEYPENNNIVIRNIKTDYVMIFDGEDWILNDKNEMMDKIISDNEKLIHTKFLEWYDDKSKKEKYKLAIGKFEQYLEQSSNQTLIDAIKKELKLLCYNIKNKVDIKNSGYIVTELIDF